MIKRELGKKIKKLINSYPVISLTGPRQSGKTTLVKQLFPNFNYINLENFNDKAAVEEDPIQFLSTYKDKGVIIDEVQRVPELFSYLQNIVDSSGKMGKFILTGSQNFLLLDKISQSLAGRVAIFHLMPFGLSELKNTKNKRRNLDDYLFSGFYPVIYDRNISPGDYYPGYIQTYIERDVRSITNVGNLSIFQRFVKLCAGRVGQIFNLSSIGNDLGINHKTVRSWLSVLEASFIIFLLNPHYKNFNKRLIKQPKIYFYDTGLLCSLLGIQTEDQINNHYLQGNIFESFIISEYIKNRYHNGKTLNAYYWRDNTGHEIDLILEEGQNLYAIEIKKSQTISSNFFKNLQYYKKISSQPDDNFFLIYGGERDQLRKHANVLSWKNISTLRK